MANELKPHSSLSGKTGDTYCGLVEISGFVAPSTDDGIIEIWNELDGEVRMHVPKDLITGSRRDDQGRVFVTVPSNARIRVTQQACDEIEAFMLEGLTDEVLHPDAIVQAYAHLNAQKGKTTKEAKSCKKFCRTIPWWRCAASVIVVVTVNICTSTWPCETKAEAVPNLGPGPMPE
ncbi:MAG: hypothetical protein WD423_10990 [Rhodothermales bacterium]